MDSEAHCLEVSPLAKRLLGSRTPIPVHLLLASSETHADSPIVGIASQGYPTTTSYGVGGIDLGSAQGASTSAATRGAGASRTGLAMLIAALAMLV